MFKFIITLLTICFLFNSCTKTNSEPSTPILSDTRVIALSGNISFSKLTLQTTETKNFSISK